MYIPKVKTDSFLAPASWIYGLVIWARNRMFDRGFLKQQSFEDKVAVICIGNLAVGGTGKTPHTEYIVRLLKQNGFGPIAVLSRGYKRLSKGFILADDKTTSSAIGDESYQLHRKFPDILVAVDEKRPHGIRRLLSLPEPPKVIVLDDAMQHRYVKPGLTICLTSYHRILYKDRLLPMGRLREPAHNLNRADIVLVTKCPATMREEVTVEIIGNMPVVHQPVFYSTYQYGQLVNLATGEPAQIDHATQVLIVAGIADPSVLQNYVQTHYRLLDVLTFDDHHHFSTKDINLMKEHLNNVNVDGYCTNSSGTQTVIITTEKDAARLVDHPSLKPELRKRIYYLPTEVCFLENHKERFDKLILDYVNQPRG